jgi:hypothetical protein
MRSLICPARAWLFFGAFALLGLLPACGGPHRKTVYPTHGKVLVNGKPAADAFVHFTPVNPGDPEPANAYGQVDETGSFAASTYVSGDGVAAGEYILTLEWPERSGILKNDFGGPDRLKGRYKDPKTSKFRFTVEKKSLNEVPAFEL